MDKLILDRTVYKQIKAMDRERMQRFLTDIYMNGKEDAESSQIDLEALEKDLSEIKGVGSARLVEIMTVVKSHISSPTSANSEG